MLSRTAPGEIYEKGEEVTQNDEKAIYYFQLAADQNNREALFHLGDIYLLGSHGITQNSSKAIEYYNRAADLGSLDALCVLWRLYFEGRGALERNLEEAKKYYKRFSAEISRRIDAAYSSGYNAGRAPSPTDCYSD